MSTSNKNLPTLADLTTDIESAWKNDQLNFLLSQNPPPKWIVKHPIIKKEVIINGAKQKQPYEYLPIDKVEHLLRKIFKEYKIEITSQGSSFNGVWVTVRVHFKSPINGEWYFHDGIGASQLQTKSGTSPSDLQNINNNAISMAFPLAKTLAVKDACDMFGNIFGANLNRADLVAFTLDSNLAETGKSNTEKMQAHGKL
ncbi:hypothetical protein [Chryseobacterium lathyri]|uniref:hypothetical protein n=1 Tax=Chryseobacterium lathyri TaxID=395933 RepID=UPI001CC15599|nr:hypothetical protein [Chryseobacterium lathyri]